MAGPRDFREFSRREFIKTVSLGLGALPAVGLGVGTLSLTGCGVPVPPPRVVNWPIARTVYTTAQRQVLPVAVPSSAIHINPGEAARYAANGYSTWTLGGPLPHILRKDLAPAYAGAPNV